MLDSSPQQLLSRLPKSCEVRDRLGRQLREASLLRRLLRLTEQIDAEDRKQRKGTDHG